MRNLLASTLIAIIGFGCYLGWYAIPSKAPARQSLIDKHAYKIRTSMRHRTEEMSQGAPFKKITAPFEKITALFR